MFSYSTENAEFFSKKVEFLKRSYFYRLWADKARFDKLQLEQSKIHMPIANNLPLNQINADEGIINDEEEYNNFNQNNLNLTAQQSNYSQNQQFQFGNNSPFNRQQQTPLNNNFLYQQQQQQDQFYNQDNTTSEPQTQRNNQQTYNNNQQPLSQRPSEMMAQNLIQQPQTPRQDLLNSQIQHQQSQIMENSKSIGALEDQEIPQYEQYVTEKNKEDRPVNLKFGDIIYLKFYVQSRKKGIISGDGIASNKLELIPQEQETSVIRDLILKSENENSGKDYFGNNGKLVFRKCLFQVQNSKKYTYMQQLKEHAATTTNKSDQKAIQQKKSLQKKTRNEIDENNRVFDRIKGINVIYGQEIQLKHIYSSCTLTLNPKILAKANCCREMSLEENDSDWSNFRIISVNKAKKMGEPVLYSDYISLVSVKDKHQCLNIDEFGDRLEMGLEVNAFESPDPFKLCNYLDYEKYEERTSKKQGKIVQSGDIITLMNRDIGGNLGVKLTKTFESNIQQRKIYFEFENRERIPMTQPYYNNLSAFEDTQNSNILYIDKLYQEEEELNIMVFWEVQKADSFDSEIPNYDEPFRLKNVATGLYLMIDKGQLVLSRDGQNDCCLFFFETKKSIKQSRDDISYNTRIKLLSYVGEKEVICLDQEQLQEIREHLNKKHINEVQVVNKDEIEKNKASKCIFEITPSTQSMSLMADQVSSLLPYLLKFYTLLQEWGMEKYGVFFEYSHKKAFEEQKTLYNGVLQLNQSLENLLKFLTGEDDYVLHFRQTVLYRNGILSLLISILQLIHFQIYGQKECAEPKQQQIWSKIYNSQAVENKSAQKIAYLKLKNVIPYIYQIIILMIKGNTECSSYILSTKGGKNSHENFLEFFLDQYRYYKQQIQVLLREAVRFTCQPDNEDLDEDEENNDNITKWTSKLQSVSIDNIEEQTFIIELLGLTITDSLERPIKSAQTKCRKQLFKGADDSSIFKNSLISFSINEIMDPKRRVPIDIPVVHFHYDTNKFQNHMEWRMKNLEICTLYKGDKARNKFVHFDAEEKLPTCKSKMFQLEFINGYIEGQLHTVQGDGVLSKYEEYVLNCLQLYYYLCKGRNLKSMKEIQDKKGANLTTKFVYLVLNNIDNEHLKYYKCFLNLYQSLIMEVEPFSKISEYDNKCFIYEWIKNFSYTDESYKLFREITFSKKKKQEIKHEIELGHIEGLTVKDLEEITELKLVQIYSDIIFEREKHQFEISKQLLDIYTHEGKEDVEEITLPDKFNLQKLEENHMNEETKIDLEKATYIQLEAFLAILKLIKIRIDLGFNTMEENMQVYHSTANIFLGLIYYHIEINKDVEDNKEPMEKDSQFNRFKKNWIFKFIKTACHKIYNDEKYNLILIKVFVAAIDIYSILLRLKEHLQVVIYLYHQINDHEFLIQKREQLKNHKKKRKLPNSFEIEIDPQEMDELNSPLLKQRAMSNVSEQQQKSFFSVQDSDSDSADSDLDQQSNNDTNINDKQKRQQQNFKLNIMNWRKILDIFKEDMILLEPSAQNYQENKSDSEKVNVITLIYKSLEICQQRSKLKEVMSKHMIRLFKYPKEVSDCMTQVEIIEDNYELHLFKLVNGSERLRNQQTAPKSAKDWKYMSLKTIKFIKMVMSMDDIDRYMEIDFVKLESSYHDSKTLVTRRSDSIQHQESISDYHDADSVIEKRVKSRAFQSLKDVYENCKDCLRTMIYFFEMSDYDIQDQPPIRPKEDYILQIQNIIRSSGIYKCILDFLPMNVYKNGYFLEFYRLVIDFLYLFTKNNKRNKEIVLPYFDYIAELAILPCQNDVDSIANRKLQKLEPPRPLKTQTLCIELLKEVKLDGDRCAQYITLLFDKIRLNEPFSTPDLSKEKKKKLQKKQQKEKKLSLMEILENIQKKLKFPNPDLLKSQALIQWMRILKSLCFKENNCNLKENQQKILNSMLRTPQLVEIITPIRPEYIKVFIQKFDSTNHWDYHYTYEQLKRDIVTRENEFCKIKLHVVGLSLLTTSFKNYLQGIQEVQRFIMFESLKNVVCNQFAPFMIKRAYIRTLFEAYINKVVDPNNPNNSTDTVESDDISGILSGEIIPQLDTKNIYIYLEGLVRIPKNNKFIADEQWEIRKQIIIEKIQYFGRNKEFQAMCDEDSQMIQKDDSSYKDKKYIGILKDPREFWKYLMDDGVMHFLTDTYDEKIKDIENENQKDNILVDEFSIIKTNMMKLRQLFDILERDFRVTKNNLHLDVYRELMNQIEDIIPKRKIIKFGKNFRIGIDEHKKINVETYDTVAEDMVGQGFQDIDEQSKFQNPMKKYLRIFFMRNRIDSSVFESLLLFQKNELQVRRIAKGVFNILNKDKIYLDNQQITQFIHFDCGINQLQKKALDRKQDWSDFTQENIDKVIHVVTQFFKKAKGPKEIMEGQDENLHMKESEEELQKIIALQSKSMLNVEKIQSDFCKLIFRLVKIDYIILNGIHTEDEQFQQQQNPDSFKSMFFQQSKHQKKAQKVRDMLKIGIKETYKKRRINNLVENERIMIDTQIMQILRDFITDFKIHDPNNVKIFQKFIQRGSIIFKNQIIYKIKLIRLFLQHIKLTENDLADLKDDDNNKKREAAELKKQNYILFQNNVIKSHLYLQAIKLLDENASFEIKYESLNLLNEILFLGNEHSQKEIYQCLKNDKELQLQFFTFLRHFFLINRYQELKKIKILKLQNPDAEKTEFEVLALKILELLRLLCENVNSDFQNFLRTQVEQKEKGASTNIILEVSNFLTYFLEDTQLEIYQKQEIIIQSFDTLTDLVTGQLENQQILCNNKRLFSFLNDKIIMPRHDFSDNQYTEKEKQLDIRKKNKPNDIKIFNSAIYFLLIVINANKSKKTVLSVLEQLDTFQLIVNMKQIFEQRIYPHHNHHKMNTIVLEIRCDHIPEIDTGTNNPYNCTETFCGLSYITREDIMVVETGFNIFIFFSYMYDMFPNDPKLKLFSQLIEEQTEVLSDDNDDDDNDDDSESESESEEQQQQLQLQQQQKQKEKKEKKFCFCCKRKQKPKNSGLNEQQIKFNQSILEKKKKEDRRRRKILSGDLLGLNEEALQEMEEQKKFTIKDKQLRVSKGNVIGILTKEMLERQKLEAEQEQSLDRKELEKIKKQKEEDRAFFVNLCKFTGHRHKKFFKFYKKYRGVIEVLYSNGKEDDENKVETVQRVYFQKPFLSNYLTDFIKKHLIEEAKRDSDQERIEFLRQNYKYYFEQMNWKQRISKNWLLYKFANNWRRLKALSFYMVVTMTLIYLYTFDSIQENSNDIQWVGTVNDIVAYSQAFIAFIVVVFCAIEKQPISLHKGQIDNSMRNILAIKDHSGFDDKLARKAVEGSQWIVQLFSLEKVKKSNWRKFVMMAIDFDNIYNVGYLFLSFAARSQPYVYAILLLDIVKQSPDLQGIIKSITQNIVSILKFAFLGLIIMTIYGIILYNEFGPKNNKEVDFDGEVQGDCFARKVTFCDDFIMTITTCFNVGLTAGGGIADGLKIIDYNVDGSSNDHYWKRYIFDLSWFILIQLLFIQIIFGIIVDSFSEIRQKRNELLEDIENKCFICGLSKAYIDEQIEKGWNYHIYMEHNVYHMLFYMIYIMKKNKTECDALEKQVKKQLDSKPGQSLEFIPIRRAANINNGNLISEDD